MTRAFLCKLDDVPGEGAKGLRVGQDDFIILRHGGQIRVYRNRCPHAGINLEWRADQFFDLDGNFLQCATHGALFRPEDGYCVRGPCAGEYLQAVKVKTIGNQIYLL